MHPQDDYEIYKLFADKPIESILLYAAFINKEVTNKFLNKLQHIKIKTTGDDLISLGIPQGKIYKDIFDFILKTKLKNPNLGLADELKLIKETFL